ncbi:MAG: guanylate kinase [Agathobacter sp.]|nr:guanylate kinase [Agathobacter sp.]
MGKIFCVMGKSATGKDTIYESLLGDKDLQLKRIIPYTTRPIRDHEEEGREYHFCTEEDVQRLDAEGRIVEMRQYNTVYGLWKYFTVNDGNIHLDKENYMLIGTVEGYVMIRDYFGAESVVPIYVEVEDGERLLRAISREKKQDIPKYEEMCRRFLADAKDFSEENIKNAGITRRFPNWNLEQTIAEIKAYIVEEMQ